MMNPTFEAYLAGLNGKYLLYLDPFYYSMENIITKDKIQDIIVVVLDYSRKGRKRRLKMPLNETTRELMIYLNYHIALTPNWWSMVDKDLKYFTVDRIIINKTIEISKTWWNDIFILADKKVTDKVIDNHKTRCEIDELMIVDQLDDNLNYYFRLNSNSTVEKQRMSSGMFIKYINSDELYDEKVKSVLL